MREILFRGQVRRKGEKVNLAGVPLPSKWVFGGIFPQTNGGSYSIIYTYEPLDKWPVYAETVGQSTGLKDRNGHTIFEGDIILDTVTGEKYEILYNFGGFVMADKNRFFHGLSLRLDTDYEITGNIYDDPELLKGEPPCSQPSKP